MPYYSYDDEKETGGEAEERPEAGASAAPEPANRGAEGATAPPVPEAQPMPLQPGSQAPMPLSPAPRNPGDPGTGPVFGPDGQPIGLPPSMPPEQEFRSIRRFVTASQICALVSLVIGGVPLSTVAIVLGLVARSKANGWASNPHDPNRQAWMLLRRSASIAAIMAAVALVLNAISLAVMYPVMMDMLQNGDLGSLMGGSGATGGSTGGSSSAWG